MSAGGGWGGGASGGGPPPQQGWQQPPQQTSPSGLAVAALICGIGSWVILPLVAAIAGAIIGKIEIGKIERGESPEAGRTFAQVGYYASLANIVLTVLGLIVSCCIFFVVFAGAAGVGLSGS